MPNPNPINPDAQETFYLLPHTWPLLNDPDERRAIAGRAIPFLTIGPDPTGLNYYHAALSVEQAPNVRLRELADRIRAGAIANRPAPDALTCPVLTANPRESTVVWWRVPSTPPAICADVLIHLDGQDYRFALFWPTGVSVLPATRSARPGPDGYRFALVLAIYAGDHLPFPPLAVIFVTSQPFPTPALNVAEYLDAKAPKPTDFEKSLGV